jgi:ATP-binding cassette subfamily B (MDR/TAP) protein 1
MRKLKTDSLETLIKQEMSFFDAKKSATGSLTSEVSSHPANIGAATGIVTGEVIVTLTNVLACVIMGMVIERRSTIVCIPSIVMLFLSVSEKVVRRWQRTHGLCRRAG